MAPCKDCLDRHFNCHGTCPKYQQFKLELAKVAEARERERASTPELCKDVEREIWRWKKRR